MASSPSAHEPQSSERHDVALSPHSIWERALKAQQLSHSIGAQNALASTRQPKPFYARVPSKSFMTWLYRRDEGNVLCFTEGYLPRMDTLHELAPLAFRHQRARGPPIPEEIPELRSQDEGTAWLVTALAQREEGVSLSRAYGRRHPTLETWLVGFPKVGAARLTSWFEGLEQNTDYRLMIHRMHPTPEEIKYDSGQPYLNAYRKLRIRHRGGPWTRRKNVTHEFLDEMLNAYRSGTGAVESFMDQSGHPYCWSCGIDSP